MTLIRMTIWFSAILKMNGSGKTKLSDQTKVQTRWNKKTENNFHEEINQRKLCSKKVKNMLLLLTT